MKKLISVICALAVLCALAVFSVSGAENAGVADGTRVATEAAAMVFPTDGTSLTADCPVCGVSATWLPLTPEVLGAGFTAPKANTHYYLTGSVEAAGVLFTMANSSTYTSCLHLNGKDLVSTGSRAIEGKAGKLNILGSGTVKGNGSDNYGNVATVRIYNKGSVNLYGGTYEKYDPAAATNTIGHGYAGGTISVYSGATVKSGTAGSAAYVDSRTGEKINATLNIYGGTIDATGSAAVAVVAEASSTSTEGKVTINMTGGVIKNGTGTTGGNVFIGKDATFNLSGGEITGGTATNGGNIYVAEGGIFNMTGGSITGGASTGTTLSSGVDDGGGNIYIYNSGVMNLRSGTVSGGKANVSGGNIYVGQSAELNVYGGEITGGKANLTSTNYLTGGGNIFVSRSATFNMSGGTISSGEANKGGNIGSTRSATLNLTGGIVEKGVAKAEGGNIFSNSYSTSNRVNINLSNVIIREGTTTAGPGGNLGISAVNLNIGEGTQILDGKAQGSSGRGGNVRIYGGSIVMTGGKLSGGTAAHSDGTDEVWVQGSSATNLSVMYMLGGVIEGEETKASSLRVDSLGRLYLGGDATVVDNKTDNAEIYGNGPVYICDGWSGSATIRFKTPGTVGTQMDTSALQVVTLDADRNATVGGSFSGKLKDFTNGVPLIGTGDANGSVAISGVAMVDAAGNVTMTADPLTDWATGNYAFIRLFSDYTLSDSADGLCIDLNGCDLTLSGSGNISVFDSANDTYQADACGKVVNNGTVTLNQDVTAPNGNRYLAVAEGSTTTMHRIDMNLTDVTLRTTAAGIYYKAKFVCDETLAAKVKSYGVVLSLADMPGEDFLTESDNNQYTIAKTPFASGVIVTSGSVFNIMKDSITDPAKNAARGEMDIYANPYICFDLGSDKILVADTKNAGKTESAEGFDGVAMSLHDVLTALDDNYFDYDADTQAQVDAFYKQWQEKGMADWEFVNVGQDVKRFNNGNLNFTAGSNVAKCPACGDEVTWTPVSQAADTTTKIGVAEAGAHYYLTENITFTGSGSTGFITGPTAQGTTACLHLNGHDLTSTKAAAIYSPYARMGVLNVMGNGTVSGNASGAGTTVYLSSQKASGAIHLYGGTYVKPASNSSSMVALINGGSIHVYDGAWLKGNGSGNAVYMDLAGNAATTFAVHGGKVTGGEVAVAEGAGSKARKFIVDGAAYIEEMVIRNLNVEVEISGNPVIDRIALKPNGMLTIGTLTKGAKIGVSTSGLFTKSFAEAADYLKYFYAWNTPDSISVTEAGALCYDINYEHYMTPYIRDVKAEAIADGEIHYYFMAAKGMVMSPTNGGDIDKWGDSCLVVFPNGETMLIDSGYAIQAPVIIGSLKRMGVTELDYLLITHPHGDHIGGAFSSDSNFLDEIQVKQAYYQDIQYSASWDGVLERKCAERNIPYTPLWKGNVLTFGEGDRATTLTMLWPGEEDLDLTIDATINKHSMVFRFDYGEHSSLFTADIYDYTDKKLIAMYTNGELDVDMMKVPHHGLGTNICSSALLQATTPEIAVATGSFDISATVTGRFDAVGTTLLEDRFHGYIHIASGRDGVMTTETE